MRTGTKILELDTEKIDAINYLQWRLAGLILVPVRA